MLYVTRKAHFAASHRLFNPHFSDEKNDRIFDRCNNRNGHGHNYVIEVTVRGVPDPETGYVIDLKELADIIEREILDHVDHRHLNLDVDFLSGIIPTAENLAVVFWRRLEPHITAGELCSLRLFESENNYVEYHGEPVEIPVIRMKQEESVA